VCENTQEQGEMIVDISSRGPEMVEGSPANEDTPPPGENVPARAKPRTSFSANHDKLDYNFSLKI